VFGAEEVVALLWKSPMGGHDEFQEYSGSDRECDKGGYKSE